MAGEIKRIAIRHPKIMAALDHSKKAEPWDRTTVKVMPQECANCLLGPDPLVGADEVQGVLNARPIDGRVFECHLASIAGRGRCCHRFFWEARSLVVRLARGNGWWSIQNTQGDLVCTAPDPSEAHIDGPV